MDGDGGAMVQRRRSLDVEAADMEERQHREDMIVGGRRPCMCWLITPFHSRACCFSTAPFGLPVVPEV